LYKIWVTKPGTSPSFPEAVSMLWFQTGQQFAAVIRLSSRTWNSRYLNQVRLRLSVKLFINIHCLR
jgi:hypothetical protein